MPQTRGAKLTELKSATRQTRSTRSNVPEKSTPKSVEKNKSKATVTPKLPDKSKSTSKKSSKDENTNDRKSHGKSAVKEEEEKIERRSPVELEIIYDGSESGKKNRKRSTDDVNSSDDASSKKKSKEEILSPVRKSGRGLIPKRFDDMQYEFGKKAEDKYLIYGVKTTDVKKKTPEPVKRSAEVRKRENKSPREHETGKERKIDKHSKKKQVKILPSPDQLTKSVKKVIPSSPHMEHKKKKHKNGKEIKSRVDVSQVQLLDINLMSAPVKYDLSNVVGNSPPKQKEIHTKKIPSSPLSKEVARAKPSVSPNRPISNLSVSTHLEEKRPKSVLLSPDTMNNFTVKPVSSLADKNIVEICPILTPEQLQGKASRTIPFQKRLNVLDRHLVGNRLVTQSISPQVSTKPPDTASMHLKKNIQIKISDPIKDPSLSVSGSGMIVDTADVLQASNTQQEIGESAEMFPPVGACDGALGISNSLTVNKESINISPSSNIVQPALVQNQDSLIIDQSQNVYKLTGKKDLSPDISESHKPVFKSILKPSILQHQIQTKTVGGEVLKTDILNTSGHLSTHSAPYTIKIIHKDKSQTQFPAHKPATGSYVIHAGKVGVDTAPQRPAISCLEKELTKAMPGVQDLLNRSQKDPNSLSQNSGSPIAEEKAYEANQQVSSKSSMSETSSIVSHKEPSFKIVPVSGIKQSVEISSGNSNSSDEVNDHKYSAELTATPASNKLIQTKPSRFVYQSVKTVDEKSQEDISQQPIVNVLQQTPIADMQQTDPGLAPVTSGSSLTSEEEKPEKMQVVRVSVGPDGNLILEECDSEDYVKEKVGSGFKLTEKIETPQSVSTSNTVLQNTVVGDPMEATQTDYPPSESPHLVVVDTADTVEPPVNTDSQGVNQLTGLNENILVINLPEGVDPQSIINGNHGFVVNETGEIQTSDIQLGNVTSGLNCPSMIAGSNLTVINDGSYTPLVNQVPEVCESVIQSSNVHLSSSLANVEASPSIITYSTSVNSTQSSFDTEPSNITDKNSEHVNLIVSDSTSGHIQNALLINSESLVTNESDAGVLTSIQSSEQTASLCSETGVLITQSEIPVSETTNEVESDAPDSSFLQVDSSATSGEGSSAVVNSELDAVDSGMSSSTGDETAFSTVAPVPAVIERCTAEITDCSTPVVNEPVSPPLAEDTCNEEPDCPNVNSDVSVSRYEELQEITGNPESASDSITGQPSSSALCIAGVEQTTNGDAGNKLEKAENVQFGESVKVGNIVMDVPSIDVSTDMNSASTQTPIFDETDSPGDSDTPDKKEDKVDTITPQHRYSGFDSETNSDMIVVHLPDGLEIKLPEKQKLFDKSDIDCNVKFENGQYKCLDCDYVTDKKVNCYKHRRKHLGLKPYICTMCAYSAATSSNLKRHMAQHTNTRQHRCYLCDALFRQKIHLERHIRYKHEEKKVKCPLCDYVCANENPDLKVHIKRKHMPQEIDESLVESFTCDECGLVAVSKRDLKQHMKFHRSGPELKLFCSHCSFVTDCESRLKRHLLVHTKEKPFKCGLCEYRGTQKEHVLRHMKAQHDINIERRSKKLDALSSDSSNDSQVKLSEKADYSSQEKIFACNHCTMKFSKLINLYKHLYAQHKHIMPQLQEGEYGCVVCDFRTTVKKNLLVHMRRHNIQEQRPPSHVYSCVLCKYMNPKRRNLFQHMKKKHRIEIVMKEDGSTNCFVVDENDTILTGAEPSNVLTIGDLVTATATADLPGEIISEDSLGNGIENEITIEEMTYTYPKYNKSLLIANPRKPQTITIADLNEAQEAIEGLQALSEQRENKHFRTSDGVQILTFDPDDADEDDENSTDSTLKISDLEPSQTNMVRILGTDTELKNPRVITIPGSQQVSSVIASDHSDSNIIHVVHPPTEMLDKNCNKIEMVSEVKTENPDVQLQKSPEVTSQADFNELAQPLMDADDENVKSSVSHENPNGVAGQINSLPSIHIDFAITETQNTDTDENAAGIVKKDLGQVAAENSGNQEQVYESTYKGIQPIVLGNVVEKPQQVDLVDSKTEGEIVMEVLSQSNQPEAFIQINDPAVLVSETGVFQLGESHQNIACVEQEQQSVTGSSLSVSESAIETQDMIYVTETEDKSNIQLTEQDILQLSSNDIVEINGELYRVEAAVSGDSENQIGLVPFPAATLPS